jgi:hypothetical protein
MGGYGWRSWPRLATDDKDRSRGRIGPAQAVRRVTRARRRRASSRPSSGKSGAALAPGPAGEGSGVRQQARLEHASQSRTFDPPSSLLVQSKGAPDSALERPFREELSQAGDDFRLLPDDVAQSWSLAAGDPEDGIGDQLRAGALLLLSADRIVRPLSPRSAAGPPSPS